MTRAPGLLAGEYHLSQYRTTLPWDTEASVSFWGGPFSNFAMPNGGLRLPAGYYGHPAGEMCVAPSVEHYMQACKAIDPKLFQQVLAAPGPKEAKRLGGAGGIVTPLRPDWEQVKVDVVCVALRVKFACEPYRTLLLATGQRTIVEASPFDAEWGGWDRDAGTWTGRNLLGICLMRVRAEIHHNALEHVTERLRGTVALQDGTRLP